MNALVFSRRSPSPPGVDLDEELRKEVRAGHFKLAEKLLENSEVNPDSQDAEGWTALMYAAHSEDAQLMQLLLKAEATLDLVNRDGETALVVAVKRGNVEPPGAPDGRGRRQIETRSGPRSTGRKRTTAPICPRSFASPAGQASPGDGGGKAGRRRPSLSLEGGEETPRSTPRTPSIGIEGRCPQGHHPGRIIGPARVDQLDDEPTRRRRPSANGSSTRPSRRAHNVLTNIEVDFIIQMRKKS
jgi:hypothetical protein